MKNELSLGVASLLLLTACAFQREAGPTAQERGLEAVATVEIKPSLVPPPKPELLITQLPRVETGGACAPQYSNGRWGTCISSRACRGFAVRTADGSIQCSCYGDVGGCGEAERCDEKLLACVPDKRPTEGRSR